MLDQCTCIIVPMDGDDASRRAAGLAEQIGSAAGIPVKLLHVHPVHHGEAAAMARVSREELERAGRDAGSRAFGEFADKVGEEHCHVIWGEAAEEIPLFVEKHEPALVVMGRGHDGTLSRRMLGSVSDAVLRRATGPVTIVS